MSKHEFYIKSANGRYVNPGCTVICDTGNRLTKALVTKMTKNFVYMRVLESAPGNLPEGARLKRKNPKKMWVLAEASAE